MTSKIKYNRDFEMANDNLLIVMTRSYIYNWHTNAAEKFTITLVAVNASEQGSALRWRHNGRDGVLNHHLQECLLNRLLRRRSKKTSKLRVTGLCVGNSPVTGEFSAQMASDTENVSIWWRNHGYG